MGIKKISFLINDESTFLGIFQFEINDLFQQLFIQGEK